MQITLTNGTLTQVQETLSPASGYELPDSITVTGATSLYNNSTGAISLSSITENMLITAEGEVIPIIVIKSSFNSFKLNNNVLTFNGTDFTLNGTATVTDTNNSSFKGISAVDNGDNTITLNVNGNSIIVSKHVESSGYSVAVNFNESDTWAKTAVCIYDGQDNTAPLIFEDTNQGTTTPSTTVSCSSGYLYVTFDGAIAQGFNTVINSGDITASYPEGTYGNGIGPLLTVGSDGEVTISVAYDD